MFSFALAVDLLSRAWFCINGSPTSLVTVDWLFAWFNMHACVIKILSTVSWMQETYPNNCIHTSHVTGDLTVCSCASAALQQRKLKAPVTVRFLQVSTDDRWILSTKDGGAESVSMPWRHCKNIETHAVHTNVAWPNTKQWQMAHTSDLIMITL